MSYRRSPAATSVSLPSFSQAFRSPSPSTPYTNRSAQHSHPMPPSHARSDSRGTPGDRPPSANQLPPLRYMNSSDPRDTREVRSGDEMRRGDSGEGRKRPHEDLDRDNGRNPREDEAASVKPEPLSPPGSPYPKRARPNSTGSATHLSPNNSAHSSSTGPMPAPVSPVVAGFALDPERPEAAQDQVRRSLQLKQQQQEIIQRRKEQAEGGRERGDWLDQRPVGSPHLAQQRSPGQVPQQPLQQQQQQARPPPPTLAARRGPLTASKAAHLTIQTASSGASTPAFTSSHSREHGETHTLHPANNYGRPLLGHPTSALRGGIEGIGEVRSAPPQQTRFAVPPLSGRSEASRGQPQQITTERRPLVSISQTSREMQRERVQDSQTPREHRQQSSISSVPLSRNAQRTPSVLRPIQRDQEPSPPMTGSTTAVSSISRRPTFDRHAGGQATANAHHYPFGGVQGGPPLQTAPLLGRGDILQQQQAAAAASHGRGLPGQYPPPTAGLPPPTAGTSAAAVAAGTASSTPSTGNLDNLTPEQRTFLHPFLTFYDSILDSQKLKEWLKKEIDRAGRANQSLMDNHHAIERLIGNAVKGVRDDFGREREQWERRVADLEKRVRELEGRGPNTPPVMQDRRPASAEKGNQPDTNGMQVDEPQAAKEGEKAADR
ncbi:hypothetical protein DACRYDRAFT_101727 [Dacryopinax primogenitus]|uniref:Uncharacterized protein n=1 Tax=Dacryopinax primogenitus (strain DJM 731) TaxID=1858805 RepID=M5G4J4_DACPD|nr:uncharacterized protein DACRYDRAFT_101727 [Dacryopinax primogenitus]EJT98657.1 hypothetical protein DACRYDRAFT_101727 [Dacryopinax primogenitus]